MAEKSFTGRKRQNVVTGKFWPSGIQIVQALAAVLVLLNALLLYGIFLSPNGIRGYQQQSLHVEELQSKVQKLKRENNRMFRKIQGFKNNPQALERLVREQLGWVKENEIVVEFIPSNSSPDAKKE
jgi:cell division protein FtsB